LSETHKRIAFLYDIFTQLIALILVKVFLYKGFFLYWPDSYEVVVTESFVLKSSLYKLEVVCVKVEVKLWSDFITTV